uniref:Ig-like domain-containing protein n=1 Tax=Pavo cristatus TaxID=9049 RepID=A0A8C9EYP1_PAVCR
GGQPGMGGLLLPAVGALQASQEPAELRVAAGTNVSLQCQLVTAEPWSLARITWLKDGGHEELCATRLHPKAAALPCATPDLHLTWSPPHANLSLHGAQEADAGCYVCHIIVEIPYHATASGNGTLLHVSAGIWDAQGAGLCPALLLPPGTPGGIQWGLWDVGPAGALLVMWGLWMAAHPWACVGSQRGWGQRGPAFPLQQELMECTGQVRVCPLSPMPPPVLVAVRKKPSWLCLQS